MESDLFSNNPMVFGDNQYANGVFEKLKLQREQMRFADIVLVVAQKNFQAHRCVLAACSPYFDSILKANALAKEQLKVCADNAEVFERLLQYIYTGTIIIDKYNISELLKLADKLLLTKLKEYCAEYLQRYLEVTNCLTVLEMANKFGLESLHKIVVTFIYSQLLEVIEGEEILGLTVSRLENILGSSHWKIPNDNILPLVSSWVFRNIESGEDNFRSLLTWVSWKDVNPDVVENVILNHPLFTSSEKYLTYVLEAVEEHAPDLQASVVSLKDLTKTRYKEQTYSVDSEKFLSMAISSAIEENLVGEPMVDKYLLDTEKELRRTNFKVELPTESRELPHTKKERNNLSLHYSQRFEEREITNLDKNWVGEDDLNSSFNPKSSHNFEFPIDEFCRYSFDNVPFKSHFSLPNYIENPAVIDSKHKISENLEKLKNRRESVNQESILDENNRKLEDIGSDLLHHNYGDKHSNTDNPIYDRHSSTDVPNYDDRNSNTDNPIYGRHSSTDNPNYDDRNSNTDNPIYGRHNSSDNPNYNDRHSSTDIPNYDDRNSNTDNSNYDDRHSTTDNPNYDDGDSTTGVPSVQAVQGTNYEDDPAHTDQDIQSTQINASTPDPVSHPYKHTNKKKMRYDQMRQSSEEATKEISTAVSSDRNTGLGNSSIEASNTKETEKQDAPLRVSKDTQNSKRQSSVTTRNSNDKIVTSVEMKCSICSASFTTSKGYYKHMVSHFPGPPHQCDTCLQSFKRIYHLLDHRSIHTDEKQFKCPICSFSSRRMFNLKEHMIVHNPAEKPFSCEECGALFSRKSRLTIHMTKHTNDRPHSCNICNWTGKTKNSLLLHTKTHSGDLYSCQYPDCAYRTAKKSHLESHMQYHTQSRPFVCKLCQTRFISKSHLLRHHKQKHENLKTHQCPHCDFSSSRRDGLMIHIKRKHLVPLPPVRQRKVQLKKKDALHANNQLKDYPINDLPLSSTNLETGQTPQQSYLPGLTANESQLPLQGELVTHSYEQPFESPDDPDNPLRIDGHNPYLNSSMGQEFPEILDVSYNSSKFNLSATEYLYYNEV